MSNLWKLWEGIFKVVEKGIYVIFVNFKWYFLVALCNMCLSFFV